MRFEVSRVMDAIEQRLTTDPTLAQAVVDLGDVARFVDLDGGRAVNLLRVGITVDALSRFLVDGGAMLYAVAARDLLADANLTSKERMVLGRWANDGLIEVSVLPDRAVEIADFTGLPLIAVRPPEADRRRFPWLAEAPERVLKLLPRGGYAVLAPAGAADVAPDVARAVAVGKAAPPPPPASAPPPPTSPASPPPPASAPPPPPAAADAPDLGGHSPLEGLDATKISEPAGITAALAPDASAEPAEPAPPTEPGTRTEPAPPPEPANQTEPANQPEPVARTEPATRTEPTTQPEPATRTEPTTQPEPATGTEPAQPSQPAAALPEPAAQPDPPPAPAAAPPGGPSPTPPAAPPSTGVDIFATRGAQRLSHTLIARRRFTRAQPSEQGTALLGRTWRCPESDCPMFGEYRSGGQPVPALQKGKPACPRHGDKLKDVGARPAAYAVSVVVEDLSRRRFVVAADRAVLVGRSPEGPDDISVGHWLHEAAADWIDPVHLRLEVREGRLVVTDDSANGTVIWQRSGPDARAETKRLHRASYALDEWDSVELYTGYELVRGDRRLTTTVGSTDPLSVMVDAPTVAMPVLSHR